PRPRNEALTNASKSPNVLNVRVAAACAARRHEGAEARMYRELLASPKRRQVFTKDRPERCDLRVVHEQRIYRLLARLCRQLDALLLRLSAAIFSAHHSNHALGCCGNVPSAIFAQESCLDQNLPKLFKLLLDKGFNDVHTLRLCANTPHGHELNPKRCARLSKLVRQRIRKIDVPSVNFSVACNNLFAETFLPFENRIRCPNIIDWIFKGFVRPILHRNVSKLAVPKLHCALLEALLRHSVVAGIQRVIDLDVLLVDVSLRVFVLRPIPPELPDGIV